MKKYEKYKDSGIEWIGEIPSHWEVKRLKYLADIVLGKMLTSEDKGNYQLKPYLRAANLSWLHVNLEDVKEMWFSEIELDKYFIKKNDLLVSEGGEVGRTCIWNEEIEECYIQNSVHKVTMNDKCDPNYFLQLFYLYGKKGAFDLIVNRISIAHLTVEKLKEVKFTTPPLEEQTAIASYLDRKTSEIDELIADKKRLLELYEEEKTAIINELVTGKKVWDGNAWTEPAKVKDSGIEWLGEIPEHWEVKKIKHLLKRKRGALKTGPFGSQLKTTDLVSNGEYKVYTQRNVLDNDFVKGEDRVDENKFLSLKEFLIEEGDILFTSRGSIGKCNVFPPHSDAGILHPCLIRIQIDRELVCEEWILNYANNSSYFVDNVKYESNSTIIDVIYGGTLKEIVLPIAPLPEQITIANYIESECACINAKKARTEKLIDLLTEYRTALISEVVTGKIKVTE